MSIFKSTFHLLQLGNVEVCNDMKFHYRFHPRKRSSFPRPLSSLFTFFFFYCAFLFLLNQ